MKRALFGVVAFAGAIALIALPVLSQPPEGKDRKDGEKNPPRFEVGQIFPPPLLDELKLTHAQEQELETIKRDLRAKIDKLLTDEQKDTLANYRPRGPGRKDGPLGKEKDKKDRPDPKEKEKKDGPADKEKDK